ncbi:hypothetical protein AJ79_02996 [Helicocarpus griseus UAMH5409]|uniref:Uncharacterized protein n=1 Tax=Helicocarpus griseus UAMH5409 TaxID=1447875 RepID=A0A2B7Y0E2_9EURO|nr:hypothetical protein AJ79_02996 [Helicocarpus griseus UAMH5409]
MDTTPVEIARITGYPEPTNDTNGFPNHQISDLLRRTGLHWYNAKNELPSYLEQAARFGLVYRRRNGTGHAVNVEKHAGYWWVVDWQHNSGRTMRVFEELRQDVADGEDYYVFWR